MTIENSFSELQVYGSIIRNCLRGNSVEKSLFVFYCFCFVSPVRFQPRKKEEAQDGRSS